MEFTIEIGDEVIANGSWAKVVDVCHILEEACVCDEDGQENWVSFNDIDEL